jgi:hypothetical protein
LNPKQTIGIGIIAEFFEEGIILTFKGHEIYLDQMTMISLNLFYRKEMEKLNESDS